MSDWCLTHNGHRLCDCMQRHRARVIWLKRRKQVISFDLKLWKSSREDADVSDQRQATALAMVASECFASLRQRPSHAKVRSTTICVAELRTPARCRSV